MVVLDNGPEIKAIQHVSTPAIVGICLGASLFLVTAAAVTCFCYKRRFLNTGHEKFVGLAVPGSKKRRGSAGVEKPLAFQQPRRPTAVKSPAGAPTHYLKKSPSPTGPAKSPPGAGTPSPTKESKTPPQLSGENSPVNSGPAAAVAPEASAPEQEPQESVRFYTECERSLVPVPSKQEIEENKHNLGPGQLGELVFKLRYRQEKSTLIVTVVRCRGLPALSDTCDPYIKLQLLPDKKHTVKTRVLRKTCDPVYDEDYTFYGIQANQLQGITLHFVVLSFDRYSRDDIIGEVFYSLNSSSLSNKENHQQMITRDIMPRSIKIRTQGRGEILVSLCWQPAANRLTVVILKARNLPKMDVTGLADPYVKMYLLVGGQRVAKKKTHVKKRTLNPVFNESFVLEVPAGTEGLQAVSLEFLLLDWDRVTKNEVLKTGSQILCLLQCIARNEPVRAFYSVFYESLIRIINKNVIGRLELGGSKCTGSALHHWNEVCSSPRRQIAEWHKLRE